MSKEEASISKDDTNHPTLTLTHNESEISLACDSFYEIPVCEMTHMKRETDKR